MKSETIIWLLCFAIAIGGVVKVFTADAVEGVLWLILAQLIWMSES